MLLLFMVLLWPSLSWPVRTVPEFRVSAPASFLSGRRVELVGFTYWQGYYVNAVPAGHYELRCARFPWVRFRREASLIPEFTGLREAVWTRDSVTAMPNGDPRHQPPVVFSGESLNVLRFCP